MLLVNFNDILNLIGELLMSSEIFSPIGNANHVLWHHNGVTSSGGVYSKTHFTFAFDILKNPGPTLLALFSIYLLFIFIAYVSLFFVQYKVRP